MTSEPPSRTYFSRFLAEAESSFGNVGEENDFLPREVGSLQPRKARRHRPEIIIRAARPGETGASALARKKASRPSLEREAGLPSTMATTHVADHVHGDGAFVVDRQAICGNGGVER